MSANACCCCCRRGLPCCVLAGGLHLAWLPAASAAPADGRSPLPPFANAGCIPVLCRAPGGVCACLPSPAWPLLGCCGVPLLSLVWWLPPRCPAGLPLLLAALPGDEPGKGCGDGSFALVTKGCFSRRVALARSRATLQQQTAGRWPQQQHNAACQLRIAGENRLARS